MKGKTLLIFYNLIICLFLLLSGIFSARHGIELINSLIFLPLVFYFSIILLKRSRRPPIGSPATNLIAKPTNQLATTFASAPAVKTLSLQPLEPEETKGVADIDRRVFLKLIGSAGVSLFMLALFTKKAQAAFFGSVPGPGTVALKDTAGNKINPAEKQPTDAYKIAQLDDTSSTTYAYYGFLDKDGNWYILRETLSGSSQGDYRYVKGSSSFSTNWTSRSTLTYDTFGNVF